MKFSYLWSTYAGLSPASSLGVLAASPAAVAGSSNFNELSWNGDNVGTWMICGFEVSFSFLTLGAIPCDSAVLIQSADASVAIVDRFA